MFINGDIVRVLKSCSFGGLISRGLYSSLRRGSYFSFRFCFRLRKKANFLSMMEPPKSDHLCDRFVTGNLELDNWIWILEYFAKFKTELWMLHDAFEMCPKLPDYLGEHTNEMVAFRCLVSLFDSSTPGLSEEVASDVNSKIEFDSSESSEYVLQCILDEIPLSELKPGAPGLLKWNLLPFIKSKLLCLPKCALELMIEPFSCVEDTEVSPCQGQMTMRSDGQETDRVISPMADADLMEETDDRRSICRSPTADDKGTDRVTSPMADADVMGRTDDQQSICSSPGGGAEEISRSDALLERSNEGVQNKSDGYASSLSENRYRCVQCKESGKLLFCSGDGCTVMVHQKCLDSAPVYDDAGNFYCSLCASTYASAEYLQSLDEVTKAKKKLISFLSLMSKVNKKKCI